MGSREPIRKSFYIVQSFTSGREGVRMDAPVEVRTEAAARRIAERLSTRKASVIAFERSGDVASGDFDEPRVLVSYGNVDGEGPDSLPF